MSDINQLPAPNMQDPNYDNSLAELKSNYKQTTGTYPQASYPESFLLEQLAYEKEMMIELINHESRQNLLAFAKAERLDHYGFWLQTPRLKARGARTQIKLTFAEHSQSITIPRDYQLRAEDNQTLFNIEEAAVLPTGTNTVTLWATCTQTGIKGNGFVAGEIKQTISPLPYLASAVNISVSSGGAETEQDENYRKRLQLAPGKFTTAGSQDSYEFHTRSAHQSIVDAKASSPSPNVVKVCALVAGGLVPDSNIQSQITNAITAKKVRPIGDNVSLQAPEAVNSTWVVNLEFPAHQSALAQNSETQAKAALETLKNQWQNTLGQDIVPEELIAICQKLPGVTRATTTLTFVSVQQHQFPNITSITVNTSVS